MELDNERRLNSRYSRQENIPKVVDAELRSEMERLSADVNSERRDKQRIEREHQKMVVDLGNKVTMLESRVGDFREKLRNTKEQLKEKEGDLAGLRAKTNSVVTNRAAMGGRNTRKREITTANDSAMIGTPGDMPITKRNKLNSTLVGEKSMFSITPFLSRTAGVAPESPKPSAHSSKERGEPDADSTTASDSLDSALGGPPAGSIVKVNVVSSQNAEARPRTSGMKNLPLNTSKKQQQLEQVEEENIEGSEEINRVLLKKPLANDIWTEQPHMKKTKTRLLMGGTGKSLFDDEAGTATGVCGRMGGMKMLESLTKKANAENKGANTFGTISPLRKDKKMINV